MMIHIDAEALALIALGDVGPSEAERAHLQGCATCAGELNELRRTVDLGRSAGATELVAPPADVWTRIRTDLHLPDPTPGPAPAPALAPPTETDARAHLARRRPRRTRPRFWVPLAAAALVLGLVAGTGAGIWWQSAQQTTGGIAIAGAELDPFPAWPNARGSAVVEQNADGVRQVVVDIDPAASDGGSAPLREVWLIKSDGTSLVSIGFLDGSEGRFDVPADVDLVQYSLVDVSAESDDGDPTHSGDSIVRGQLRAL